MDAAELAWNRFKLVWEHLQAEISIYWTRYSAFLVAQAAVIAFAARNDARPLLMLMSVFGVFSCLIWTLVCRASLAWLQHWRHKAYEMEQRLDSIEEAARPDDCIELQDKHGGRGLASTWRGIKPITAKTKWERWGRPTRIAALLPPILAAVWVGVGIYAITL